MRRIYRCRWNRKVAGICGGLGVYFQIDPTLIRLLFIISLFISMGLTLILYLICWAFIPQGPAAYIPSKGKRLYRVKRDRYIAGVCGGLAKYFNIDSRLIRIATLVLTIATGFLPIVAAYFIAAFIIPEKIKASSFRSPR